MLDLIQCSLRLPGRVRRPLCAPLSHVKLTKAGEWGSELFGRVPDPSHRRICMWNRHFTPPHSLIVAKIICEIAFHQECFPRQLSRFYMHGGPTELTHAPLHSLPHVRFLSHFNSSASFLFLFSFFFFEQLPLSNYSRVYSGGKSTCCPQMAGRSDGVITTKEKL